MGCGPSFDSQARRKDRTILSLKARLALQVCDLCSLPGPWIYTDPTLNWMLCCCSLEIVDNFFKQRDLPFYFALVWKWFCPNVSLLPPKARKAFCPDNSFWLHNLKSLLYHSTPSHFPVFSFWLFILTPDTKGKRGVFWNSSMKRKKRQVVIYSEWLLEPHSSYHESMIGSSYCPDLVVTPNLSKK